MENHTRVTIRLEEVKHSKASRHDRKTIFLAFCLPDAVNLMARRSNQRITPVAPGQVNAAKIKQEDESSFEEDDEFEITIEKGETMPQIH